MFFTATNLITKNQSGFRSGDSTTNQLLTLVNEIHESFDNRNSLEVRSVFLDISKAFDKVWHEGLIFKLKQNGVGGNVINLLGNYLSSRKQRVVINGKTSEYFPVESGVPQGSVLGPLLFLIYINDIEIGIKSKVNFFADDTMIYSVVHNPTLTASVLNHDLEIINQWAHQWKMSFNPEPSKQAVEILFSQKKIEITHPPLFFNGTIVNKVNEYKHLGLTLDSKLTFSKHINDKINKSRKLLGVLKFLSSYLPLHTLIQIYKMYIRPHLDYCDIIYHIPPLSYQFCSSLTLHSLMESIERIQYQAALFITGTWKGTNRNKLYDELGWESLSDRRWCRRLIQMFKIHNGLTPCYLNENLPPKRRLLYGNNNPNVYYQDSCNSFRIKNIFSPDSIRTWNNLRHKFHSCTSLSTFKSQILTFIRPEPKLTFSINDRQGLKPLFSNKDWSKFIKIT